MIKINKMEEYFKNILDEIKNELSSILKLVQEEALREIKEKSKNSSLELLTRKEAAKLLCCSLPTLDLYTEQGSIKSYRLGNSIRFKKEDLENALIERGFSKFKNKK